MRRGDMCVMPCQTSHSLEIGYESNNAEATTAFLFAVFRQVIDSEPDPSTVAPTR
jgi:hypothetical protein